MASYVRTLSLLTLSLPARYARAREGGPNQAWRGLVCGSRDCDLIGSAIHELATRQFFHQIRVGMGVFHQLDAMGQPIVLGGHLGEFFLLDAQFGLGIFQGQQPTFAPNGIAAEIPHHRNGDGGENQSHEKTGD
jgi:hypothetical protein